MKEKVPFSLVSELTKAYKGTISRPFGHNCIAIQFFLVFGSSEREYLRGIIDDSEIRIPQKFVFPSGSIFETMKWAQSRLSLLTKAYKGTISGPFSHNCKAIRYFSLFWLFRTEGAARAEPSLFELCRVVSEEDALGDDRRPLRSNAEQECSNMFGILLT